MLTHCKGIHFCVGKLWYYYCSFDDKFIRVSAKMSDVCPSCERPRANVQPTKMRARRITQVLMVPAGHTSPQWLTLRNEER